MKKIISLKNKREFSIVYNAKQSKANQTIVMYIRKNDIAYNRLGISVSKKVGNSVIRHRIIRLVREAYRLNNYQIKQGYDLIVVGRVQSKDSDYHVMERAFLNLIKRLNMKI
jgi:ribonuclease P protein component